MNVEEAEKLVAKLKPEKNYFTFQVDFSTYLVVPAGAALKIMEGLTEAELFSSAYGQKQGMHMLDPEKDNVMRAKAISPDTYRNMKMAQLLNIDYRDIQLAKEGRTLQYTDDIT